MPYERYAAGVSPLPRLALLPSPSFPPLPIDPVLPSVVEALAAGRPVVLLAPPGAGKTTRVPLALLDAPWAVGGRILVLEPRRLAARAAAHQMARLLGERVGERVGYRVRHDSRVGPATHVEVVTEGVLTRLLQDDPSLPGVAAVLFDEFHERHLLGDLGLALTLESQAVLRPELRIVVMSATLDATPLLPILPDPALIVSEGRQYPVAVQWQKPREGTPLARAAADAVVRALTDAEGDLLVFLPGIGEIQRTAALLTERGLPEAVELHLLHGNLDLSAQDAAVRPAPPGRRKIILSTSIAESSLTIEGVRVVIDAGLARVPRYSARSGMSRLETVRVSQASAEQRRGRAGRLGPGVAVRLWSEGEHMQLLARPVPEILEADLTALALELAAVGISDAGQLAWIDPPPAGALAQGRTLLRDLGALDSQGRITAHGRAMAELGLHPRLAHLVLSAAAEGLARLGCELAALLTERDPLLPDAGRRDADLRHRIDLVRGRGSLADADRGRLDRIRREASALMRDLGRPTDDHREDIAYVGALVARAYPDRIAMRRPGGGARYLLRNGRGAKLDVGQPLDSALFLAIAELDGDPAESRIWMAAPLDETALRAVAGDQLRWEPQLRWDEETDQMRATEREAFGALVLRERPLRQVPEALLTAGLVAEVRRRGIASLPWRPAALTLRARLQFLHHQQPDQWPDLSDPALLDSLDRWLAPHLEGKRRWRDLESLDLGALLESRLGWERRAAIDRLAPTHLAVPSGSRVPIDYSDPTAPLMAVRLQEVFGWAETPRIGPARTPLTLHLLSPAHRPVQVTRDLASFWKLTYFDVRKDLKGRYPRHPWPDDPLTAPATRRAKPRGS